jgi:hypothetical protein
MVNVSNFHQTWPPLLLKTESLTKKSIEKFCKVPIVSKLWVWLIPIYLAQHLEWPSTLKVD